MWLQLWLQLQIVVVMILDIAENCRQMQPQLWFANVIFDIILENVAAIVVAKTL